MNLFRRFQILTFLACLWPSLVFAWPPTFGTEFNFTSQDLEDGWFYRTLAGKSGNPDMDAVEQEAAQKLSERIRKLCAPDCEIIPHDGKFAQEFKVRFKDGWWFNISIDPAVVEIQTAPATKAEFEANAGRIKQRMQTYIFDAAEREGLLPQRPPGANQELAAHLNIGALSAFEDDPKSFMAFFADYANHPELGTGLLGNLDLVNAPPVRHLSPEQQQALQLTIDQVNKGKLKSVPSIASRIQDQVYTHSPAHAAITDLASYTIPRHYQGIGLKQLKAPAFPKEDRPFEIRAIRQPRNAAEYGLQVELIQARMEYVRAQKGPVLFIPGAAEVFTPEELAGHFYVYTKEMGLDWKKYAPLLQDPTRKILARGKIPKLLMGDGDFRTPEAEKLLQRLLADRVTISPWARTRLATLIQDRKLTRSQVAGLLSKVAEQVQHGVDHAVIVENYLVEMTNNPALAIYRAEIAKALEQTRTIRGTLSVSKLPCRFPIWQNLLRRFSD